MGKVYSSKITVLIKLNLHWTVKEWTVNLLLKFWTLKCALVMQWRAGVPFHYILDDEETFVYVLILLLPLFCNFSQWVYRSNYNTRRKLLWEPGEGVASSLLFLWKFHGMTLVYLNFSAQVELGWILYAQLVSSLCVYLFIFIKIVVNTGEIQLYASTLIQL